MKLRIFFACLPLLLLAGCGGHNPTSSVTAGTGTGKQTTDSPVAADKMIYVERAFADLGKYKASLCASFLAPDGAIEDSLQSQKGVRCC